MRENEAVIMEAQSDVETLIVERVEIICRVCGENCFGAAGRGYCTSCNITFPLPTPSRKELMQSFSEKFFMSRVSGMYHREGCKYLRNIAPENLIEINEPIGKPCRCAR